MLGAHDSKGIEVYTTVMDQQADLAISWETATLHCRETLGFVGEG